MVNAMENMGDTSMSETIRFVQFFDRFFDCLNGTNQEESQIYIPTELQMTHGLKLVK